MTSKKSEKSEPVHELSEFLSLRAEERERPPGALLSQVRKDLEPSPLLLGLRLLGIHSVAGSSTVLICPQFGVGPWGGGHGLMGFFMQWGDLACAVGCGGFFAGVTALAARLFLARDERRIVREAGVAYFSALMVVSVFAFMWIGDAVQSPLSYIVPWALAGVLVSVGLMRLGEGRRTPSLSV